jgi:hypothetical protein
MAGYCSKCCPSFAVFSAPLGDGNRGYALLKNMGYRDGEGLGKDGHGMKVPLNALPKHGKRGLGPDHLCGDDYCDAAPRGRKRAQTWVAAQAADGVGGDAAPDGACHAGAHAVGDGGVVASAAAGGGSAAPHARARCASCAVRVGWLGFPCRCGVVLCAEHRFEDGHACTAVAAGVARERAALAAANPRIVAPRVDKI